MFTPIDNHPLVGKVGGYAPQGAMPYAVNREDSAILYSGDVVDVLSVWTRDYLPDTAPDLIYVQSRTTGQATHIAEHDFHRI